MWNLALSRRVLLFLALPLLAGGGIAGAYFLPAVLHEHNPLHYLEVSEEADGETAAPVTLKAVRPKLNGQQLVNEVTQPAYVQAFYKADLMARVAGPVKKVYKDIGDTVAEGEALLDIDVPDLERELLQKDALVQLAEQEVRAAQTAVTAAKAAEKEAAAQIRERESLVQQAAARRKYANAVYVRVRKLAESNAVEASLVDERLKNVEAADAEWQSARTGVESARANLEEFSSKVASALVDVEVKKARVQVARADRERVRVLVDLASLRAPFKGIVASRHIDPGTFVQNASTGNPTPLMTLLRTDLVTLVMWVPERDAPHVHKGTEAAVRLDALGRQVVPARVSRVSYWLDPDKSRDMRVEVDLPNRDGALRVGMYGSMTLTLQRFDSALLLPASAVFTRGGKTHLCEVRDGKAHLVRVRVQHEDGICVKVARLVNRLDDKTRTEVEQLIELTGDEVVVRSGQGELHEGQEVEAVVEEW